jgi:hypothetical protein
MARLPGVLTGDGGCWVLERLLEGLKDVRAYFCEQKETKKLYDFGRRLVKPTPAHRSKSFLVLFFKKESPSFKLVLEGYGLLRFARNDDDMDYLSFPVLTPRPA